MTRNGAADGRDLLTVTGTGRADTITINDTGGRGRGRVVVDTFDGQDRASGGWDADIGEVRVSTLYGDDDVVYNLTAPLNTSRIINVDLGDRDDSFVANLGQWNNSVNFGRNWSEGDLLAGSNLDIRVRGGSGDAIVTPNVRVIW